MNTLNCRRNKESKKKAARWVKRRHIGNLHVNVLARLYMFVLRVSDHCCANTERKALRSRGNRGVGVTSCSGVDDDYGGRVVGAVLESVWKVLDSFFLPALTTRTRPPCRLLKITMGARQ